MTPRSIQRSIPLKQLAHDFPAANEILALEYGLHCLTCKARDIETLEQGARLHGMNDADIDELVQDLNKRVQAEVGR